MMNEFERGTRVVRRWDRVFDALSAEPRRQVILSLMEAEVGEAVSLPEGAVNPNVSVDEERLRHDLYHRHLPALSDAGFVDWETEPMRAYRGPDFAEAAAVFESLQVNADGLPDSLVYGCRRLEDER